MRETRVEWTEFTWPLITYVWVIFYWHASLRPPVPSRPSETEGCNSLAKKGLHPYPWTRNPKMSLSSSCPPTAAASYIFTQVKGRTDAFFVVGYPSVDKRRMVHGRLVHGRPGHPSPVRMETVTVMYVTVDGWGVLATYTAWSVDYKRHEAIGSWTRFALCKRKMRSMRKPLNMVWKTWNSWRRTVQLHQSLAQNRN